MHNTVEVGVLNDRAAVAMPTPNKEGEILNKKIKNMVCVKIFRISLIN